MSLWQALVLGVVEGLTEFLPVSSTGHLTIVERLLGLPIDSRAVTGFTAVVQMGAIAAVLLFFARDVAGLTRAGVSGVRDRGVRAGQDWQVACAVVVGLLPIAIVGLAFKDVIAGPLRNLTVIGIALLAWSVAMVLAECKAAGALPRTRALTVRDGIAVGLVQCFALVPGVSRSGATISAGLFRGVDRVTATRLSFYLSIPVLTGAGIYELRDAVGSGVGAAPTILGTVVAFLVAYASVAWFLRFVAHNSIAWFVPYRVMLGVTVLIGSSI